MTRVYAKVPRSTTSAASAMSTLNSDASAAQPQSTATPSPIPIRDSRTTESHDDSVSSGKDTSALPSVKDEQSGPSAPGASQPPNDLDSLKNRPTPVPGHDDLKVPSLAHKARLRIHFEDLTHPAVAKFLAVMPISTLLQTAISNVQKHLFTPSTKHHTTPSAPPYPPQTTPNPTTTIFNAIPTTSLAIRAAPPPPPPPQHPLPKPHLPKWTPQEVRAVTLILRPMDGVAYTTGTTLDPSHKEIHLNTGYISDIMNANASKPDGDSLFRYELMGVITHEMVHVFQYNAHNTCPGGLIEGIADHVRLKSGLGAKHWKPWPAEKESRGEKWDEGYQRTAWFLGWVEEEVGRDVVGELNFEMRGRKWEGGKVWEYVVGEKVEEMWKRYEKAWEGMNKKHEKEEGEGKEVEDGKLEKEAEEKVSEKKEELKVQAQELVGGTGICP